jgi:hypothetical protein
VFLPKPLRPLEESDRETPSPLFSSFS